MSAKSTQITRFDKLYLFSFVWAVATLLHLLSFSERINFDHPQILLVAITAVLVILKPQDVRRFLLMLLSSIINTAEWIPFAPNHITFEFVINVGVLGAILWSISRLYLMPSPKPRLELSAIRETLFDSFAPFVRISLLILYFYAVLHKLNWDYFNLNISCSTFLLHGYSERIPFLPDSSAMRWMAVWGTIIIEAAIPLLLCFRNTRSAGILLGCGFHLFLSIHPHQGLYSFSAMLFAIYALFTPYDFPEKIKFIAQNILGSHFRWLFIVRVLFAIGIVSLLIIALGGHKYIDHLIYKINFAGLVLWFGWALLLIVTYLLYISKNVMDSDRVISVFKVQPIGFWFIPILIFVNGMSPYLGLKTQTSFSMFSNLRTEGGITNHILLPTSLQISDLQKDLVEVVDTDVEELKLFISNNQLIPYFEFKRITSNGNKNFYINYIRNKQLHSVKVMNGISDKPELLVQHNWILAKLVRFRPVDKSLCLCKH